MTRSLPGYVIRPRGKGTANVQRTLRHYVNEHGPVRSRDAVRACFPTATERERKVAAAALAVDAREGRLDRLAYGLYDRRAPGDP